MLDVQVFSNAGLAPGTIQLHVDDGAPTTAPPLTVIAYVTDEQASWSSGMHFAEHASEDHLLCYPSTADAAIAVAAYVGSGHKGGVPGQLASSSSRGRRIDGLALMSVAAPNDPVTALAGSIGGYRVFGGTSGAAPHVAAGAALLLQREPSLDGGQVRDALRQSALVDEAVGVAPNDDFGYGKLRIHQALYGAPPPAGAAPTIAVVDAALTVGEVGRVTLAIDGAETVELDRDYDGVYDETIDVDGFDALIEEVGITHAKVRAVAPTGHHASAVVPMIAEPAVDEPAPTPKPSSGSDDGGCRVAGTPGRDGGGHAWVLLALGVEALRRRRARRDAG
ncbi:MAG: S8 family serine peptidase, partial [Polyangiaceae bacterium]